MHCLMMEMETGAMSSIVVTLSSHALRKPVVHLQAGAGRGTVWVSLPVTSGMAVPAAGR